MAGEVIILVVAAMIPVLGFFAYLMYLSTFRNTAHIARQTGKDISDVVWIKTKFKVVNLDGSWRILFRNVRESTGSVEGKFWTKFVKPKKALKFSEEQWKGKDLSKLIQRGLYLYETSEGVFFPMTITTDKDGNPGFRIIDQDNRMFLINEIEHVNSLTKNKRKEMMMMIAIIIGVVVLGVVIFGGMYYMNKQGTESIATNAQICGEYARAVFNATTQQNGQFIGKIPFPGG